MKIDIERSERTEGLIFKKPVFWVSLTVRFSEEEKAVIQQRRLKEWRVVTVKDGYKINGRVEDWWLTIGDLLPGEGRGCRFDTPIEAQQFEAELKSTHLPVLKQFLTSNAQPVQGKESFEL